MPKKANASELFRVTPNCYEAFFREVPFLRGQRLLEPAAGDGRISRHLLEQDYVGQTTLVELRPEEEDAWQRDPTLRVQGARHHHIADYLAWRAHYDYDLIVANPPFSKGLEFVFNAMHQVRDTGWVVMLQELDWLATQKRSRWFATHRYLRHVYIISWRITFELPNGDHWTPPEDFAWYLFQTGCNGPPTIEWLLAGDPTDRSE